MKRYKFKIGQRVTMTDTAIKQRLAHFGKASGARMKHTKKYGKALWVQIHPEQAVNQAKVQRAKERRLYIKRKNLFLQTHPLCEWWLKHGLKRPATQVHHQRGRGNGLLLNEKFWSAVSQTGHTAIHHHPVLARELGLLAPQGKWGVNE